MLFKKDNKRNKVTNKQRRKERKTKKQNKTKSRPLVEPLFLRHTKTTKLPLCMVFHRNFALSDYFINQVDNCDDCSYLSLYFKYCSLSVPASCAVPFIVLTFGRTRKFIPLPPPWYNGERGLMESLHRVFDMLQYFQNILPLVFVLDV